MRRWEEEVQKWSVVLVYNFIHMAGARPRRAFQVLAEKELRNRFLLVSLLDSMQLRDRLALSQESRSCTLQTDRLLQRSDSLS